MTCFIALLALLGCHSKVRKTDSKITPKEALSIALPSPIEELDWNFSTEPSASIIETNIMEGLTGLELAGPSASVTPAIAESWDVSSDGLQYTFHLRDDVKWTDGKALTAQIS